MYQKNKVQLQAMTKAELKDYIKNVTGEFDMDVKQYNLNVGKQDLFDIALEVADLSGNLTSLNKTEEIEELSEAPQKWTRGRLTDMPIEAARSVFNEWGEYVLQEDWVTDNTASLETILESLDSMGALVETPVIEKSVEPSTNLSKAVDRKKKLLEDAIAKPPKKEKAPKEPKEKTPRKRTYSDDQIRKMFELRIDGFTYSKIAERFSCSGMFVRNVLLRNVYKDVNIDDLLEQLEQATSEKPAAADQSASETESTTTE